MVGEALRPRTSQLSPERDDDWQNPYYVYQKRNCGYQSLVLFDTGVLIELGAFCGGVTGRLQVRVD
jgi:hypothetical protein